MAEKASSQKIERVSTGVPGLDQLMQGGFIKNSGILLGGCAGTGKTIFCLQFLWDGLKKGENCLFITLEENAKDVLKDALAMGMDFSKYEKAGKFKIIEKDVFEEYEPEMFVDEHLKANRVVVDSFTLLAMSIDNKPTIRKRLYETMKALKDREVTTIFTSEAPGEGYRTSKEGIEEFVVDCVIILDFVPIGTMAGRNLFIKKMRRTKHSENLHPFEITSNGIKILSG